MASNMQNMEDALTCPICTEVFREPVTLSCQHNYCRVCLQKFSETSRKKKDISTNEDDTHARTDDAPRQDYSNINSSTTQSKQSVIICCPICRQPTNLGSRSVAGLPTNFTLAEIVENFLAERRKEKERPLCSVCEDKTQSVVKACTTCRMLYCTVCFTSCHPEKGAFKRHQIISVDVYLSQKKAADPTNSEEKNEASDPPTTCDIHRQTLSIFCLICPGCLNDHDEHSSSGIEKVFEKQEKRAAVPSNSEEENENADPPPTCFKHRQVLSIFCVTCHDLICTGCLGDHDKHSFSGIEKALEKDKVPFLEKVKLCDKMKDGVTDCLRDIHKSIADIKEFKTVSARMDDQLSTMRDRVKAHEDLKKVCTKILQEDTAPFRHLILTEKNIKKPMLQFTKGGSSRTRIKEDGLVVAEESPRDYYRVYTDGNFQTGQYYWEFEVTVNLGDDPNSGCNALSVWYIEGHKWDKPVLKRSGQCKWITEIRSSNALETAAAVMFYQHTKVGIHIQALTIWVSICSITFIDCSQNKIIWTRNGVDVSKVLVPFIGFRCINIDGYRRPAASASARLTKSDNAALQQIVSDALSS